MEEKKENEIVDIKSTEKNAKRKNILLLVLDILLFGLLSVSFVSCVLQNKEGVENTSSVPTPLFLDKAYAQENYEDTIKITNYSDNNIHFEYNYPSDSTIYSYEISPRETYYAKVDFGTYNHVYMISSTQVFYLSDDGNLKDYGYSKEFSCESFNGSYIDIYSNYGSNFNDEVYLDLTGDFSPSSSNAIDVLGEMLSTNVARDKSVNIPFSANGSSFHLDFVDDYINFPNNFTNLVFEYHVYPSGYSYEWLANLWATSSNAKVLIASTYSIEYPTIVEKMVDRVRNLFVSFSDYAYQQGGYLYSYGQYFQLAPYLKTAKIKGTFGNYSNSNVIGFRPLVSLYEKQLVSYKVREYVNFKSVDLWTQLGDLFLVTITALMPIANVSILPFVSIGALIFAPLIVAFVMLILRLVKK